MEIQLSEIEQMLALTMANRRFVENRQRTNRDNDVQTMHHYQMEIEGAGGELAAAKFFKVFPSLDNGCRKGGCDLVTRSKVRVEVKTTVHKRGKILVNNWKEVEDSDIVVLVTGTMPNYTVAGWAYTHEVMREENRKPQKQYLAYEWQHDDLHPMSEAPVVDND